MKSDLLKSLKNAFVAIRSAEQNEVNDTVEWLENQRYNRRDFVRNSLILGASTSLSACFSPTAVQERVKIAIVGAGIAGLNAAFTLKSKGILANVYEASERCGGRIFTAENILANGLTTEMGAEFVDSNHEDIWYLIRRFRLKTLDFHIDKEVVKQAYFFDGQHRSEKEIILAIKPFTKQIQSDIDAMERDEKYKTRLDNLPLSQYFEQIGVDGWLKKMLHVAFTSEYGRDCDQQSTLNMLTVLSTDFSHNQFNIYGESDERYKVKGGNHLIAKALENEMKQQIQLQHSLKAVVKNTNNSYTLVFDQQGKTKEVTADAVILTVPFSVLREVDLSKANLPLEKMRAINEHQMGWNGKIMMSFSKPIWLEQNYTGNVFSEKYLCGWDNSYLQDVPSAGYTFFYGGNDSKRIGATSDNQMKTNLLYHLDEVFKGAKDAYSGVIKKFHWLDYPHSRGSYTCFAPGHYTQLMPHIQTPVDKIFFAGEHCSDEFQGFMNGAAQTGRIAAERIFSLMEK